MKRLQKILLSLFIGMSAVGVAFAQTSGSSHTDEVITFRFLSGKDIFILRNNEAEIEKLFALVDKYRERIISGEMPVYVDGYCVSLPSAKENLHTAFVRANRVKSELITKKKLKEADFITANYATTYNDNRDVVVVTLRIPAVVTEQPKPMVKEEHKPKSRTANKPEQQQMADGKTIETVSETLGERMPVPSDPAQTYCFAVRTNLLYDAFLLPTLGIEWRINRNVGLKLDGSLAWWGGSHDKVQKMWLLNPEVRWYMLRNKRFYAGMSGNYGEYNIYKYPLGNIVSKDTGYQGKMWGAGITVGYQLYLSRVFSLDFNLGLGYTRFDYDSFGMTDGVRVFKERDKTKNLWGPTQVGINLIWTIGGHK